MARMQARRATVEPCAEPPSKAHAPSHEPCTHADDIIDAIGTPPVAKPVDSAMLIEEQKRDAYSSQIYAFHGSE